MTFFVVPAAGGPTANATTESVRSALVSAGYKLAVDPKAHRDAEIAVRVTTEKENSLFTVEVNGKRDVKERVHLSLVVIADGRTIDEATAEFVAKNSQVTAQQVAAAVNGLSASTRVAQAARQVREQAMAAERAAQEKAAQAEVQAEEAASSARRIEEETEWTRARVTGCRQPTSLSGCDAVRTYLAKYPEGTHAEEAQTAIKASEPAMERLQKDENAWKTAGVEGCKTDRTRDACTGVELYITKFPTGLHLDEAQPLIRGLQ